MTLAVSMSDRAKASRADVEYPSMARRNRSEVVVADEIGVYHCVQRVVRRAFLCGVDPLSGNSYDHRRSWIRDRLELLAGLLGLEIAAFAVLSNHVHVILRNRRYVVALWSDQEVARRWLALFPGRVATKPDPPSAPAGVVGLMVEEARSLLSGVRMRGHPHFLGMRGHPHFLGTGEWVAPSNPQSATSELVRRSCGRSLPSTQTG